MNYTNLNLKKIGLHQEDGIFRNLPHEILSKCSTEIINKVEGVNRVVYDITSKPPGTIEWE